MRHWSNLSGLEAAKSLGVPDDIWVPGHYGQKMSFEGAVVFLEALARVVYYGEKRRDGSPKIDHMAEAAGPFTEKNVDHQARRAIGWGHDLIEEIPSLTLKLFSNWGIPQRVINGIRGMTRKAYDSYLGQDGELVEIHAPYLDQFRDLLRNPDAAHVKVEGDMPGNMDGYTKGNKLYVYQIAMAYGIACLEGIITPKTSYKEFFNLIKKGETGNQKLDAAIQIVNAIPKKALEKVLLDECSEYQGPALDKINYFDPSPAVLVRRISKNACRSMHHKMQSGLETSAKLTVKLTQGIGRVTTSALQSVHSFLL